MIENTSGWFPLLHKIIVVPEEVEIKKSMIFVPEEYTARDDQVQVLGTVVACGPEVLSDKPNSTPPKPGDVVMFAKLAGFFFRGADGKKYRMIQDLDLVGVRASNFSEIKNQVPPEEDRFDVGPDLRRIREEKALAFIEKQKGEKHE